MEIDLATKQHLVNLLAEPASVTQAHAPMLAQLVKSYPYYSPLHLLLAKAEFENGDQKHFATAALFNGGELLHQLIYKPESLKAKAVQLVIPAIKADEKEIVSEEQLVQTPDDQEIFEEIAEIDTPKQDSIIEAEELENTSEDVFDEIAELDTAVYTNTSILEQALPLHETPLQEEILPDELAIESIVATDFFAFEKRFHTEPAADDQKNAPILVTQPEEYDQEAEAQTVSKYNDDKLPYTFLWWLAKTRKEHEQIFQPYVSPKQTAAQPNSELQQQYVEHIFHLQTPFSVADEAGKGPINYHIAHRGDDIIENFIKNEPQIRAPKPEQLNNENKARKSAEDHNDLVSETLAAIYIEQTLYHKAIETYEKLSLKFPEKSRYFADLIQSLEKKI
jgi:hypothetical protein